MVVSVPFCARFRTSATLTCQECSAVSAKSKALQGQLIRQYREGECAQPDLAVHIKSEGVNFYVF